MDDQKLRMRSQLPIRRCKTGVLGRAKALPQMSWATLGSALPPELASRRQSRSLTFNASDFLSELTRSICPLSELFISDIDFRLVTKCRQHGTVKHGRSV
jgi:hypothetical protein